MATNAQRKAVTTMRGRRRRSGIVRFEVSAPEEDKALLRQVAKRLSSGGADRDAVRQGLRAALRTFSLDEPGSVLRALRKGPLFDDDMEFPRERIVLRDIDFG